MSRYVPYQPMGKRKEVPPERMQEILAKHAPKAAQSPTAKSNVKLDHELWLSQRLRQHGVDAFDGDTTPEVRCQRIREAIRKHGLECVIVGSKQGEPVTYPQAFERIYGEAL